MNHNKYFYSQLSSSTAQQLVSLNYDLPTIIRCQFYILGLHDNYLIETNSNKYILRIYRNSWRCEQAIQFELALLHYLAAKGSTIDHSIWRFEFYY